MHGKYVVSFGSGLQCLLPRTIVSRNRVHFRKRSTLLLLCNGLLSFSAFIVSAFGTFSLVVEGSFLHGSNVEYMTLTLSISVIVTGTVTLLSCSFVFFASNRRGVPHLYSALLTIFRVTMFVEVATFIIGLACVLQIDELTNSMVDWTLFIKYYQEEQVHNDLDIIQRELKCCGFQSYKDWDLNPYYSCKSTGHSRCSVPLSCCKTADAALGVRNAQTTEAKLRELIYVDGCLKTSQIWYKTTTILMMFSAAFMIALQGIFLGLLKVMSGQAKNTQNKSRISRSSSKNSTKISESSSVSKQNSKVELTNKPTMNYVHL